jgi:PKD repeat protein
MKIIYSFLLAFFLSMGAQAQNCIWSANAGASNVVTFTPPGGMILPQYYFDWNFGDGSTQQAGGLPVTHSYLNPGTYYVCLTIMDSILGNTICVQCDSIAVSVGSNCSFTSMQDSINPATINFLANSNSPSLSYIWYFGDGSPTGSGSSISHTYTLPGTYNVSMYEYTNGILSCTYSTAVIAGANPSGSCGFAYVPGPPPNQNSFTFTGASSFTNPTYSWNFGDGTPWVNGGNPTHVFITPGAYTVTMLVVDGVDSCIDTKVIPVAFNGSCFFTATPDSSVNGYFFFNATTQNSNTMISWNFGDGTSGGGPTTNHLYNAPGIYTVCINEVDIFGNIVCTFCQQINVNFSSNCSFAINQPNPVSAPGTYNFTGTASVNPTFTWDFGDGTSAIGPTATHTYALSGTYTICMTSYTLIDTCVTCQTIIVSLNPPSCSFASFPDSTNASQMYFNAWGVFVNNIINWTYGDGTSGTGGFSTHTYNSPGVYLVCMNEVDFVTGLTVCTYCDSVMVGAAPNCSFTNTGSGIFGSPTTFAATSAPMGSVYYWDFGDGSPIVTGQLVTHVYTAPGSYNACLSIGFNGAIVCVTCQPINISGNNPFCQANFVSVSVGLNAYFIDQSVAIPLNVPPLPPPVNYAWSFGDGNTSTLQFPNHQYSAPGVYIVCLTVSTVGCTSTYCDSIVIDTTINNPIGCNAYFIFTQLSPYNLVGVNLSSGTNINFSWDFGDGSPLATGPYPSHQYSSTGTYVVCLTVSDFFGCSDTYCDTLTVDSLGNILYRSSSVGFVLNIYSPAAVTSGINDVTPTLAQLFPNPAHSTLFVKWSEEGSDDLSYKVVSVDGRTVLNGSLTRDVNSIEVATLSPGFYLLQVQNANGSMETKPFVKQ